MPLSTGARLGHYEIISMLGAGGMGEVYRANDSKLNRQVALKVLPATLARDAQYMARFQREAQVLASLNHTNIAVIHGLEESGAVRALVMELVEGITLAERIAQGSIPLQEALAIARQIADALEAAHERGIIHRDLKPANVKITPEGVVKLLDFGLAKAMEANAQNTDPANSPTMTLSPSTPGMIMGTAGYMSPEQARGGRVDHRTDIWSFGVVLYEMTTGKAMFGGETVSDTLAAVLRGDLDIESAPATVQPLLRRCLERDPRKRMGWIGDVREATDRPVAPSAQPVKSHRWAIPALTAALCSTAVFAALWLRAPKAPEAPLRQFAISPAGLFLEPEARTAAISPTGKRVAWLAENKLWVRDLDRESTRALEGSEGVREICWAPDGEWLVFGARSQFWKIPAAGGTPLSLGAQILNGCAWSNDGKAIVSTGGLAISETPAAGGQTRKLIDRSKQQTFFRALHTLPGGGWKLLLTSSRSGRILVADLATKQITDLGVAGLMPVYSPTGHILYTKPSEANRSEVWALPFDPSNAKITGPGFPLLQGAAGASVSRDGTMVYADAPQTQIVVRDRAGRQTGTVGLPQPGMTGFAISPDGRRVAVTAPGDGNLDIWIHDAAHASKTRLTSHEAEDWLPRWSPDGKSVAFSSSRDKDFDIYLQSVDGGSGAERMAAAPADRLLADWSGEGRPLLFTFEGKGSIPWGIGYLAPAAGHRGLESRILIEDGRNPHLSPDGRFVAYSADGRIFVRPFPDGSGKWQVSPKEGYQPRWSRDGKELFYFELDQLMAVPVSTRGEFSFGAAVALFTAPPYAAAYTASLTRYEVMQDGHFALLEPVRPSGSEPPAIHVVENLQTLLRQAQGEKQE